MVAYTRAISSNNRLSQYSAFERAIARPCRTWFSLRIPPTAPQGCALLRCGLDSRGPSALKSRKRRSIFALHSPLSTLHFLALLSALCFVGCKPNAKPQSQLLAEAREAFEQGEYV